MYDELDGNEKNRFSVNEDYEAEEEMLNDPEVRGKLSYWKNSGSEPLKCLTIGQLVRQAGEKFENRLAISSVYQESRLTFKQAQTQVETFAAGLLALGLKKGDHVGIWAPNNIEWYISILGIIQAGLVADATELGEQFAMEQS